MNKKAQFDDVVDIMITALIVVVVLIVFGIFSSSQKPKILSDTTQKTNLVEQQILLLNYLRTPVSQTAFASLGGSYGGTSYGSIKTLADNAIKNNYAIVDLFAFSDSDRDYTTLLQYITGKEPLLSQDFIAVSYSDNSQEIIRSGGGTCLEQPSLAYIPSPDGNTVTVQVKECAS